MKKIISLVTLLAAVALVSLPAMGAGKSAGAEQIFKTKCSKCHSYEMPLHMKKDRAGWEQSVAKMQKMNPKWINDKEAKEITNYLVSVSQKSK